MGIVQPPYLLDFGKAYLDFEPDYSAEVMKEWEVAGAELFEATWPRVKELLSALRDYGIVYYDAKPANINLGGK